MTKKIVIFILLLFNNNAFANEPWTTHRYIEEYQKAKKSTDEDFLTNFETYILGISKGIVMTNLYFGATGKGNLFCPPKDKRFDANHLIELIKKMDREYKMGNTKYPNDPLEAPIEISAIWTLSHFYPCED